MRVQQGDSLGPVLFACGLHLQVAVQSIPRDESAANDEWWYLEENTFGRLRRLDSLLSYYWYPPWLALGFRSTSEKRGWWQAQPSLKPNTY